LNHKSEQRKTVRREIARIARQKERERRSPTLFFSSWR